MGVVIERCAKMSAATKEISMLARRRTGRSHWIWRVKALASSPATAAFFSMRWLKPMRSSFSALLRVRGFRRNLAPEAGGFAAEGNEILDALGDLADGLALFRGCDLLELRGEAAQGRETVDDALGEGLGLLGRLRHVDAARIHHDGGDDAVDPLCQQGDVRLDVGARIQGIGTVQAVEADGCGQDGAARDDGEHGENLQANGFHDQGPEAAPRTRKPLQRNDHSSRTIKICLRSPGPLT
jgi:hypothetical protein